MRVALLGAESTGKTALSVTLAQALRGRGQAATTVPEVLRAWCDRAGRTPRPDEQRGIAECQAAQVEAAAQAADGGTVVADTTPLMTAVYSELLFDDRSLYPFALEHQRRYTHTLLMGLDLPWVADGLQRDGPHVREPVDALVRAALEHAGLPYRMVYGRGPQRLANALRAIGLAPDEPPAAPRWHCADCGDADCEHRLFRRLKSH